MIRTEHIKISPSNLPLSSSFTFPLSPSFFPSLSSTPHVFPCLSLYLPTYLPLCFSLPSFLYLSLSFQSDRDSFFIWSYRRETALEDTQFSSCIVYVRVSILILQTLFKLKISTMLTKTVVFIYHREMPDFQYLVKYANILFYSFKIVLFSVIKKYINLKKQKMLDNKL